MEPLPQLDRIAHRLNRLALQRALYRTAGLLLLGAAAAAVAAFRLPTWVFGLAASTLALVCTVVGALSFWILRRYWAGQVEAARWVERSIDLDERLLTLVSAADRSADARLWPELELDNRSHVGEWAGQRLGIRRVPGNLGILLAGLAAAALTLIPWQESPGGGAAPTPPEQEKRSETSRPNPAPGSGLAEGDLDGEKKPGGTGQDRQGVTDALLAAQSGLKARYERSLAAQAIGDAGEGEGGEAPRQMRNDLPQPDIDETEEQPGGVLPPDNMARLVRGEAANESARPAEPQGGQGTGAGAGGPKAGEPGQGARRAKGSSPGKGTPKGAGDPNAPLVLSDDNSPKAPGGGGGGPGSAKATGPLLAPKPLELTGGRAEARFALSLGAAPGARGAAGSGEVPAEPRSSIAAGERGAQSETRSVRHESIPEEYESVIKRIFERSP